MEARAHLTRVQILSHQSKIASKIELYIGDGPSYEQVMDGSSSFSKTRPRPAPADVRSPFHSSTLGRHIQAHFERLGFLSLNSNQRSNYQARELKSVFINCTGRFLRILAHRCYANKYNLFNQVCAAHRLLTWLVGGHAHSSRRRVCVEEGRP